MVSLSLACGDDGSKEGGDAGTGIDAGAGEACAGRYTGDWPPDTTDGYPDYDMSVAADCGVVIEQADCESIGTYSTALGSFGEGTLEITSATGPTEPLKCPAVGVYQCSHSINERLDDTYLIFNCTTFATTFSRPPSGSG